MSVDEMRAPVSTARVARLATVGAAGAPHLLPSCYVLDGEVLYSAVDRSPAAVPEGPVRRVGVERWTGWAASDSGG